MFWVHIPSISPCRMICHTNTCLFDRQMAQANQARQLCREAALGGTVVVFGQKCKSSLENRSNFELP